MKKRKASILSILISCCSAASVVASIPLPTTPDWISGNMYISTGIGWGDINGDGFQDLVVSNGNDIFSDPEEVYYNLGGVLEEFPSWVSFDTDFSGHLSLGDIDNDGDLDLAVANYISSGPQFPPAFSKVYYNGGSGLEYSPSWFPEQANNTFSCALGDPDNDGDLDLFLANGESYTDNPQANVIYYNSGGALQTTPGWVSDDVDSSYDAAWADVDDDGDLDLAVANCGSPTKLYFNIGGQLETTASWSGDSAYCDNSLEWGDVDGDGFLDLAVSTNSQMVADGRFRVFFNTGGSLESYPSWEVDVSGSGYGSAISLIDVDLDGDLDLIGGSWWGQSIFYENINGELSSSPSWTSDPVSVIEAYSWGAISEEGTGLEIGETFDGDGQRKLFYLERKPLISINALFVNGAEVPISDYCVSLDSGWISFKNAPPEGSSNVIIDYSYVLRPNLAVSNWDSDIGNYVYYNDAAMDTPTPVTTPTPEPTGTITPPPSLTPTPSNNDFNFSLYLNQTHFSGGDRFILEAVIENYQFTEPIDADLYVALEINGEFWFHPDWSQELNSEPVIIPVNAMQVHPVLDFSLPDPLYEDGPYYFWGLTTYRESFDVIGNYDRKDFYFRL